PEHSLVILSAAKDLNMITSFFGYVPNKIIRSTQLKNESTTEPTS
ncbi:MAG: hypothetical protein ACI854_002939, partial [Arenicella sp.]